MMRGQPYVSCWAAVGIRFVFCTPRTWLPPSVLLLMEKFPASVAFCSLFSFPLLYFLGWFADINVQSGAIVDASGDTLV